MSTIPPLAYTVCIGTKAYPAGSVPPLEVAKQIKNKAAWGGEVPDLSDAHDSPQTADPVPLNAPVAPGLLGGDAGLPAGDNPDADFEAKPEGQPTDRGYGQAPAQEPATIPPQDGSDVLAPTAATDRGTAPKPRGRRAAGNTAK
jgi:hypothetical protein